MTVKDATTKLRRMGYTVRLEPGNKVRLSWQGQGSLDKDKVLPLIEYLKTHKQEALNLLFSETLHRVLDIFEGKLMGVHKVECKDLACSGCYQRAKVEQGRLF